MADPSTQIVLEGLTRAVADPGGMPLFGTKAARGLFSSTASARRAALRCKEEGLLRVIRSEARGKSVQEVCALTDKGLAYLLDQVDARPILQDLVRALDARQAQVTDLVNLARQTQAGFDALRTTAQIILQQIHSPASSPPAHNGNGNGAKHDTAPDRLILDSLTRWQACGAIEDCPLPELYRQVRKDSPTLTIGQFHDALRGLHEQQRVYLHPWTGPLYELPEPAFAVLVGHEVAFYASKR